MKLASFYYYFPFNRVRILLGLKFPYKGAIVTVRTLEEVSKLYFIRGLLEGTAAWEDHRRIYEACLAKDPQLAKTEIERRLDGVLKSIVLEMDNS